MYVYMYVKDSQSRTERLLANWNEKRKRQEIHCIRSQEESINRWETTLRPDNKYPTQRPKLTNYNKAGAENENTKIGTMPSHRPDGEKHEQGNNEKRTFVIIEVKMVRMSSSPAPLVPPIHIRTDSGRRKYS